MRRLRPFSIVVGILVDTVSSVALAIVYSLFVFGLQLDPGEPPTDDSAGLWNVAVTEILGLLPTVLGGFVAGRMAKTLEVRHGVAVGMAALLVWVLVESVAPSDELPAWYRAISFIARWFQQVPLAATLPRGELRGRSNRRVAHAKTN